MMKDIIKILALALLLLPCRSMAQIASKGVVTQNTAFYQMKYRGDKMMAQKDSLKAAKLYEQAIKADPTKADLYEVVGLIYANVKQKAYQEKALEYLVQFCALSDDKTRIANVENQVKAIIAFLETHKDVKTTEQDVAAEVEVVTEMEELDTLVIDSAEFASVPQYMTVTEENAVEDPITGEITIMLVEKQVEVRDGNDRHVGISNDEDIVSQPSSQGGGKWNPFKHAGGVDKKIQQGRDRSATSGSKVSKPTEDKLRMAYMASNLSTSPSASLYSFRNMPENPFAPELFEQSQVASEMVLGGRWVSTLYNAVNMREMLIVDIDGATRQLKINDNGDLSRQLVADKRYSGRLTEANLDNQAVNVKYEYSFEAGGMDEVGLFLKTHTGLGV